MKWFLAFGLTLLCVLTSDSAWAWGPGTHLHFGLAVMDQLRGLSEGLRGLLTSQTIPFLYGCVSADIVLAKRLGRAMTHCHKWDNGLRLIDEALNPRLRAFAFGYVSHLAADTISHNCYVPSKTIEAYDKGILNHMYWELLFDRKVASPKTTRLFRELAKGDFNDCDEYMESQIPTRIFDFSTNKKIFTQLLMLQGLKQWQKLWSGISRRSDWRLTDREVRHYSQKSMHSVMNFLTHHRESEFVRADPTGQQRLRGAHELKRHYKRRLFADYPPSGRTVRDAADRFAREPFQPIEIDDLKAA
jgi:hypothetical protein